MNGNIALLPMVNVDVKRGDIFYANLDEIEDAVGSEQTGRRPVLVIQNDVGNRNSPTTIVAILTTKKKKRCQRILIFRKLKDYIVKVRFAWNR